MLPYARLINERADAHRPDIAARTSHTVQMVLHTRHARVDTTSACSTALACLQTPTRTAAGHHGWSKATAGHAGRTPAPLNFGTDPHAAVRVLFCVVLLLDLEILLYLNNFNLLEPDPTVQPKT